jgi:hypothetical protein
MSKKTIKRQAREVVNFANSDAPDFITDAVSIAIEGAAIAHNLPQPFMEAEETIETATPKVAAIFAAAGKFFSIDEAFKAIGRTSTTREQHTKIPMQPISDNDARDIADDLTNIGISDHDRKKLIELICGIAAIDDPVIRQEVTADAVRAIYLNLDGFEAEAGAFVERIYAEQKEVRANG